MSDLINSASIIDGVKQIANTILLPKFSAVTRHKKSDGSFITEADETTQKACEELLKQLTPEIPMLGEEMSANAQQQLLANTPLLWCLDPLDGTTNFSGGLPYFSISLALIEHGEPLFAMVYDPVRDECFTANRGEGAQLNGKQLKLPESKISIDNAIALIDLKRLPERLAIPLAITPPYASQRSLGSVALDWCWMASNRCQLYLHSRQKLWDFAAGLLIFTEAGGRHATMSGKPLDYGHLNSQLAYAAINNRLFNAWGAWLKSRDGSS